MTGRNVWLCWAVFMSLVHDRSFWYGFPCRWYIKSGNLHYFGICENECFATMQFFAKLGNSGSDLNSNVFCRIDADWADNVIFTIFLLQSWSHIQSDDLHLNQNNEFQFYGCMPTKRQCFRFWQLYRLGLLQEKLVNFRDFSSAYDTKLYACDSIYIYQVTLARRQRRNLSVFGSSCHQPTCQPLTIKTYNSHWPCWTSIRKTVNTFFFALLLDPTDNRTLVYRFSSRCSIHSTIIRVRSRLHAFNVLLTCKLVSLSG